MSVGRLTDASLNLIVRIEGLRSLGIYGNGGGFSEKGLTLISRASELRSLVIDNSVHVTDDVLRAIGDMAGLKGLSLELWEVGRDALGHLGRIRSLRRLSIQASPTALDHSAIFSQRSLKYLDLYAVENSAEVADRLVSMIWGLVKLRKLRLAGYPAGDGSVSGIRSLCELESVDLSGNRHVGDHTAESIADLPRLDKANFGATGLADQSIRLLQRSVSLHTLNLHRCRRLTDLCLPHLARMKSLRSLNLRECTRLSRDAVRRVIAEMSWCSVVPPTGRME